MALQNVLYNAVDSLQKQRIVNVSLDTITTVEALDGLIRKSAIASACVSIATAWLPGVDATVAAAVGFALAYNMFYRINRALGLKTSKIILRSLAAAIVTNVATCLIGSIAVATISSFISGLGAGVATIVGAAMSYALMIVSGIIYLKTLRLFLKRGVALSNATAEELAKKVADNMDVKSLLKEAQSSYK